MLNRGHSLRHQKKCKNCKTWFIPEERGKRIPNICNDCNERRYERLSFSLTKQEMEE